MSKIKKASLWATALMTFFIMWCGIATLLLWNADKNYVPKERLVVQNRIREFHPDACFPKHIEGEFNTYNGHFCGYYMLGTQKITYSAKILRVRVGTAYYVADYEESTGLKLQDRDWSVVFGYMHDNT